MKITNKRMIITMLIILEVISVYLMYKSYNKPVLEKKKEEVKEKIAIKVENENGKYVSVTGFPGEGYVLNTELTKCVDSIGNEVENVNLESNGESITITSKNTAYCTLYFYLPENREYSYTGNYQVFIAPKTGNYKIELWGASGGGAYYNYGEFIDNVEGYTKTGDYINGGKGAYTKGIIHLSKNDKLYIYVGEMGKDYTSVTYGNRAAGGYNGGGHGGNGYQIGGGGGGATDVRLNISSTGNWDDFNSLKSRIMVAAGGGGTSNFHNAITGGYGGGLKGDNGKLNLNSSPHILATGGTQISGGISGHKHNNNDDPTNGSLGKGGDSQVGHGGGGGSGYYGAGGGSVIAGGVSSGAGGSSYISGYIGCIAIKESSTEENVQPKDGCDENSQDLECSKHYSGKYFTNTEMKAGNEEMPTHNGEGTMEGNTGNGYAKITFVSN